MCSICLLLSVTTVDLEDPDLLIPPKTSGCVCRMLDGSVSEGESVGAEASHTTEVENDSSGERLDGEKDEFLLLSQLWL